MATEAYGCATMFETGIFSWAEGKEMRGNEWKLVAAFVVGAVLSFLAGMYLLGPLFVAHRTDETGKISETFETKTATAPTIAEGIPNGVYRRDVDSVPDHTAVIIERIQRPLESEPESFAQSPEMLSPPPQPPSIQQPRREKRPSPSERQGGISEPVSPSIVIQPPQPPVSGPTTPPPPSAEAKRSYRVRVGIFTQESNVKGMLETLTAQGYHPYVEEEVSGNQKRYRIYAGAFENRESAERLKQELAEKGIPSVIEEKQE